MPVVEAQAIGVPVVVSNGSSLPEVAGESAIYIDDPNSIESIAQALTKLLNLNTKQRDKIIKDGKENAKRFDWVVSARQLLNIFKSVLT